MNLLHLLNYGVRKLIEEKFILQYKFSMDTHQPAVLPKSESGHVVQPALKWIQLTPLH